MRLSAPWGGPELNLICLWHKAYNRHHQKFAKPFLLQSEHSPGKKEHLWKERDCHFTCCVSCHLYLLGSFYVYNTALGAMGKMNAEPLDLNYKTVMNWAYSVLFRSHTKFLGFLYHFSFLKVARSWNQKASCTDWLEPLGLRTCFAVIRYNMAHFQMVIFETGKQTKSLHRHILL